MSLSTAEEQLMQLLWKQEKAFMKDLIEEYPDPKPATTTIATLLKRMQDKQFVDYTQYGRSREYFPLVKKQIISQSTLMVSGEATQVKVQKQ